LSANQYITSEGDTADLVAWKVYGTQGARVTEKLLDANPGLSAMGDELPAGATIQLPALDPKPDVATKRLWD
jgi:phage tail protein X